MNYALDPYTRIVRPGTVVDKAQKAEVKATKSVTKEKPSKIDSKIRKFIHSKLSNKKVVKDSKVVLDIRRLGL